MKRLYCSILSMSALSCVHDLSELAPDVSKVDGWIPEQYGPECVECVETMCPGEVQACIQQRACHDIYHGCHPPNPSCGLGAIENRELAVCVARGCSSACYRPEHALQCLGAYALPPRPPNGTVDFRVSVEAFAGPVGPVTLEVCSGADAQCDPGSAVVAAPSQAATLRYVSSDVVLQTPYVRVRGEDVQTLYMFEDVPILAGHVLPIPVVSRLTSALLLARLGVTISDSRATLVAVAFDCTVQRLAGVSFELVQAGAAVAAEALGTPFYFVGDEPVAASVVSATVPPQSTGGFANLTPGVYHVIARKDGRAVGRAGPIVAVPGATSYATVMPLDSSESAREAP